MLSIRWRWVWVLPLMIGTGCVALGPWGLKGSRVVRGTLRVEAPNPPQGYETIPYSLTTFAPNFPGERFPLLLALHAQGMDGRDYLDIWKGEADRRRIMVLAPTRRRSFANSPRNREIFYRLIDEVASQHPIDRKEVFLAGVSSGALIARWLLIDRPSLWKGVFFIAYPSLEPWTDRADSGFPPIVYAYGERDSQVDREQLLRQAGVLQKKGIRTKIFVFPDAGHEHQPPWNRELFEWMEKEGSYS